MSYTFSRRSFLKYTALSAVALAGASMLSGCEVSDPNNPVGSKPGQSLEILQVKGTLNSVDTTNGVFNFTIKSSYALPLMLEQDCFNVKVLDKNGNIVYYSGDHRGVQLLITAGAPNRPRLNQDETAVLKITAPEFIAPEAGETVVFQYMPVRANSECSMIWKITLSEDGSSSIEGSTSSKEE